MGSTPMHLADLDDQDVELDDRDDDEREHEQQRARLSPSVRTGTGAAAAARRSPHQVTRHSASSTIARLIFDSPRSRSTKVMGTSTTS